MTAKLATPDFGVAYAETDTRPQDVGRPHRRRGAPSPATVELLAAYQDAMRAELRALLEEIRGQAPAPGLLDADVELAIVRPSLADRGRLWDLAIKLGRELGSAIDADPVPVTPAPASRSRRRKPDFG